MSVRLWIVVMSFLLTSVVAAQDRPQGGRAVGIRVVTYEIDDSTSVEHLDETMLMALLDSSWLPHQTDKGHITAEKTVQSKHYIKIDVQYDSESVVISLLEMGETINEGVCIFYRDGKRVRGRCVHEAYYDWLDQIDAAIPVASAKIELIKSLNSPPTGN